MSGWCVIIGLAMRELVSSIIQSYSLHSFKFKHLCAWHHKVSELEPCVQASRSQTAFYNHSPWILPQPNMNGKGRQTKQSYTTGELLD